MAEVVTTLSEPWDFMEGFRYTGTWVVVRYLVGTEGQEEVRWMFGSQLAFSTGECTVQGSMEREIRCITGKSSGELNPVCAHVFLQMPC